MKSSRGPAMVGSGSAKRSHAGGCCPPADPVHLGRGPHGCVAVRRVAGVPPHRPLLRDRRRGARPHRARRRDRRPQHPRPEQRRAGGLLPVGGDLVRARRHVAAAREADAVAPADGRGGVLRGRQHDLVLLPTAGARVADLPGSGRRVLRRAGAVRGGGDAHPAQPQAVGRGAGPCGRRRADHGRGAAVRELDRRGRPVVRPARRGRSAVPLRLPVLPARRHPDHLHREHPGRARRRPGAGAAAAGRRRVRGHRLRRHRDRLPRTAGRGGGGQRVRRRVDRGLHAARPGGHRSGLARRPRGRRTCP